MYGLLLSYITWKIRKSAVEKQKCIKGSSIRMYKENFREALVSYARR